MEWLKIVGICIAGSIVYGLIHDQITARVCIEYFTIGHPRMFQSDSPTLHALYWGIAATWWAGLLAGLMIATASRIGSLPRLSARRAIYSVTILLIIMGSLAAAAGIVGYRMASSGQWKLMGQVAELVPPDRHAYFIADGAAHLMSYLSGFFGALILSFVLVIIRYRSRREITPDQSL